ncbi:FxsA family protein [Chungangia koreensis]|uniref:FxsA family protein n=1 Tax=Chungangia koreensis TaxID=752657 RepID=A0ABV8X6U8_9LACT
MRWFLLLIVLAPAVELSVLIYSGMKFGILNTLLIVMLTAAAGIVLAKKFGLRAFYDIQDRIKQHEMPGDAVVDGLFIFVGGILLLFPGFITDLIGLLFLFKWTRKLFKPLLYRWFRKKIGKGQIIVM